MARLQRYEIRTAQRREQLDVAAKAVADACLGFPDVRAAYAFGSYATGNIGPTSDLDVLVVRETSGIGPMERGADLYGALSGKVAVDLIVVTPEEFAHDVPLSSFGRSILGQLVKLYAA